MTAFVPTQLGVLLPSDINDLAAAGIADGEFAKRVGGAWDGAMAVENARLFPYGNGMSVHSQRLSGVAASLTALDLVVPSGYKAYAQFCGFYNGTGGLALFDVYISRGGVDYLAIRGNVSNAGFNFGFQHVVYPDDTVKILTSRAGIHFGVLYVLIPDTHPNLKLIAQPLVAGNNSIYTCPAGKRAMIGSFAIDAVSFNAGPGATIGNNSGVSSIVSVYVTPSGNSPSASNIVMQTPSAIASPSGSTYDFASFLIAGDSLVVVSASIGDGKQFLTTMVYEIDA